MKLSGKRIGFFALIVFLFVYNCMVVSISNADMLDPLNLKAGSGNLVATKMNSCTSSGGTVETRLCCNSTVDFPNTCLPGPCSCSQENSHEIKVCNCGTNKCFDGVACIPLRK